MPGIATSLLIIARSFLNLSKLSTTMNKVIFLALIFFIPFSVFSQTDEELLKQIRKEYYYFQENFKSFKKVRLNDSVSFQTRDTQILKISVNKGALLEEYFYYKDAVWPYFVFTVNNKTENRYYFDSDEQNFRMLKWLSHDKLNQDPESDSFKDREWQYLYKGRNFKIVAENSKVSGLEILRIKNTIDSLQLIKYDTIRRNPLPDMDDPKLSKEAVHELMSGGSSGYEYMSADKKIHVNESYDWYDCAGGGSERRVIYNLSNGKKFQVGTITKSFYKSLGVSYGYENNFIHYDNGKNTCYEINSIRIRAANFAQEWIKINCR